MEKKEEGGKVVETVGETVGEGLVVGWEGGTVEGITEEGVAGSMVVEGKEVPEASMEVGTEEKKVVVEAERRAEGNVVAQKAVALEETMETGAAEEGYAAEQSEDETVDV